MGLDETVTKIVIDDILGNIFVSIPPGYIACIYSHGRGVLPKILKPGLHLKIPFWHRAKLFNTQIQEYPIVKNFDAEDTKKVGDKEIIALTSDDKQVTIEGTILFRLNEKDVTNLWENIGDDFVKKIIRPITRSRIRMVISNYSSIDILTRQSEIEQVMRQELITPFIDKSIIVENVLLSSMALIR
ncbi:MAG: SPFH domain-containing protein [bacterium]